MSYISNTPYSSRNIFINSINAVKVNNANNDNNSQNLEFYLDAPIIAPPFTRMIISLIDFQIPNIIPNIGTNINDKLSFQGSNNKITLTFPSRYYNVLEFVKEFNTLILNSNIPSIVASFSFETLKLTFTSDVDFIKIINETNNPTTLTNVGVIRNNNNSFIFPINGTLTQPSIIEMPSVVNFGSPSVIFLKCDNITVNNLTSSGQSDQTFARIDVNAPFGYTIFHRPVEPTKFLLRQRVIDKLHFSLTTIDNIPISIQGLSFQATLNINFIYPPNLQFQNEELLEQALMIERKKLKMNEEENKKNIT